MIYKIKIFAIATLYYEILIDLECFNGTCHKSISYFGRDNRFAEAEVALDESVAYLSLTPFIYFAILAVIELNLLQRALARLLSKKSIVSSEEVDDQVREEKYTVGFEVNKFKSESKSLKKRGAFLSLIPNSCSIFKNLNKITVCSHRSFKKRQQVDVSC